MTRLGQVRLKKVRGLEQGNISADRLVFNEIDDAEMLLNHSLLRPDTLLEFRISPNARCMRSATYRDDALQGTRGRRFGDLQSLANFLPRFPQSSIYAIVHAELCDECIHQESTSRNRFFALLFPSTGSAQIIELTYYRLIRVVCIPADLELTKERVNECYVLREILLQVANRPDPNGGE